MALAPAVEVRGKQRRLAGSQSHWSRKAERKLEGEKQMKEKGEKKAERREMERRKKHLKRRKRKKPP